MNWHSPRKPAEITEERLIDAIISKKFPINSTLPAERELAVQLGVTRPTLREALQRMARDGWLEINQGKSTRVCNYLEEGNLAVLAALVRYQGKMPVEFVSNLLQVRELIAPAYARAAIMNAPKEISLLLGVCLTLPEKAEEYALADWKLHHLLTVCSGNPVFTLILNGFQDLYPVMGAIYFQDQDTRAASQEFYAGLQISIDTRNFEMAEKVTREAMQASIEFWNAQIEGAE